MVAFGALAVKSVKSEEWMAKTSLALLFVYNVCGKCDMYVKTYVSTCSEGIGASTCVVVFVCNVCKTSLPSVTYVNKSVSTIRRVINELTICSVSVPIIPSNNMQLQTLCWYGICYEL